MTFKNLNNYFNYKKNKYFKTADSKKKLTTAVNGFFQHHFQQEGSVFFSNLEFNSSKNILTINTKI